MIHYLIHTSILLGLSYLFYYFLLRKETFYSLNRYFLTIAFLVSMAVPLITIPAYMSFNKTTQEVPLTPTTPTTSIATATSKTNGNVETSVIPKKPLARDTEISFFESIKNWNSSKVIWTVYSLGTAVFIFTFLIQFVVLLLKKSKLQSIKDGKFTIYELEDDSSPFSFFHWIFINPGLYEPDTFEQILDHEKIHVSQSHYIDKLIAEIAVILFWYNPFAWLYRKAITNNLEFLTDSEILESGTERESYQMSLLRVSVPQHALSLTTNYNESFLTQRIKMMNERKSSAKSSWKYLLSIPVILLSMASLNAIQIPTPEKDNYFADSVQGLEQKQISRQEEIASEKVHMQNQKEHINQTIAETVSNNIISEEGLSEFINQTVNETVSEVISQLEENKHDTRFHDIKPGHWKGFYEDGEFCLFLNSQTKKDETWTLSTCFSQTEVGAYPNGQIESLTITRDQGSLFLTGMKDQQGEFRFSEDDEFKKFLDNKKLGKPTTNQMILFFIHEVNREFINAFTSKGYEMDVERLMEMSIHGITPGDLAGYERIFDKFNVTDRRTDKIVEMAIHGVDEDYANELIGLNLPGLNINKLIEAKIHGVDSEFIKELQNNGHKDISINRAIEFAIHGVSPDEISEIKDMGYKDVSTDKLIEFQIHGVTPEFIESFNEIGYTDLSPNRLIEFAIHGVSPWDVKSMQEAGYSDIPSSKLVEFAIHGVDAEFVKGFVDIGYNDISSSKLVEFAIHRVTPEFVKSIQEIGYDNVSPNKLVEMRIHGVSASFIKKMKSTEVGEMSINKIIEFAIHRVDEEYYNSIKNTGVKNINSQSLLDAKIHSVTSDFIKRVRSTGANPTDLSEFVKLKIHGF